MSRFSVQPPCRRSRGFTLVELMTTIAILAIIAALAMPGFTTLINTNRLAGLSNEVAAMLQTARMESIRRNQRVVVCPSTDGSSCTTAVQWQGWVSFIDADRDGDLDSGETILRAEEVMLPSQLWSSPSISTQSRVVFRPDGYAYDKGGVILAGALSSCLPTTNPPENARDVNIAAGTRISIARRAIADGACTAP
jgi:type IV fimbrial biogenesis protein FimT